MSEKTSRKHFLTAAGTVVAGVLAYCGLRSGSAAGESRVASADKTPVPVRPEPRAVPRA
jgi:hypothetical protein